MTATLLLQAAYDGAVYSLVSVGYALVYAVTGVVNMAHPVVFAVGAITALSLSQSGYPLWLAIVDGMIVGGFAGLAVGWIALSPRNARDGERRALLATAAAGTIVAMAIGGRTRTHEIRAFAAALARALPHAKMVPGREIEIAAMAAAVAALALTIALLRTTRPGAAIRAVADNAAAARAAGVGLGSTVAATLFVAAALGSFAGITASVVRGVDMMSIALQLSALTALVAGGMRSVPLAIAASFCLALLENVLAAYAPLVPRGALDCAVVAVAAMLPRRLPQLRGASA